MNEQILSFINELWSIVGEMSPYLLFGFLIAGALSVVLKPEVVEAHLGGKGLWPILKASLFGVPLPLCSCGVIPVSMSLRKHGASKGATISFLLSTPQTGVDSFFVTYSLLGPVFAIFRPVIAFVTGIVGGILVQMFGEDIPIAEEEKPEAKCDGTCCTSGKKQNAFVRMIKYGFITLPGDIGKMMLLGLAIAAVLSVAIPEDFFAEKLGTGIGAMLVMMLLGIPVYVCATASVPVAAVLIMKGVTPGAALVFLMTGPATNAAALTTIWKIMGSRTAIVYILTVAGCALGSGILLDQMAIVTELDIVSKAHWMLPAYVKNICAVALIAMLIYGSIKKTKS